MSYLCPACNGLEPIQQYCPQCRSLMDDGGRITDYYGPYAPYRPIDDLKLTDGLLDLYDHQCHHVMLCPNCGYASTVDIQEVSSKI